MMSSFGLTDSTALPARVAAARQSRAASPQFQQAGPCGSLCRSTPITADSFLYRVASIFQSSIQRCSLYCAVYQSSLCAAESGR